jgi:hypothetical protein
LNTFIKIPLAGLILRGGYAGNILLERSIARGSGASGGGQPVGVPAMLNLAWVLNLLRIR